MNEETEKARPVELRAELAGPEIAELIDKYGADALRKAIEDQLKARRTAGEPPAQPTTEVAPAGQSFELPAWTSVPEAAPTNNDLFNGDRIDLAAVTALEKRIEGLKNTENAAAAENAQDLIDTMRWFERFTQELPPLDPNDLKDKLQLWSRMLDYYGFQVDPAQLDTSGVLPADQRQQIVSWIERRRQVFSEFLKQKEVEHIDPQSGSDFMAGIQWNGHSEIATNDPRLNNKVARDPEFHQGGFTIDGRVAAPAYVGKYTYKDQ